LPGFAHVLIGLFVFLHLSCLNSVYILDVMPLSDRGLQVLSPITQAASSFFSCFLCYAEAF
jgi:hypothetical protein